MEMVKGFLAKRKLKKVEKSVMKNFKEMQDILEENRIAMAEADEIFAKYGIDVNNIN